MSLETIIASLVTASNKLTDAVTGKLSAIDTRVQTAENEFKNWKSNFTETINGLEVYKQGGIKRIFFGQALDSGGYVNGTGPNQDFPACAAPKAPYYVTLLEFDAMANGGIFGQSGDIFKGDFVLAHRGISNGGYLDSFSLHGTSWADSVSGSLQVKNVAVDGAVSILISEPNNASKEIKITKAMVGTTIPVDFRAFGQNVTGKARITLKIDTRYHCGADRAFSVDMSYTSSAGRPAASRVTQVAPTWNV